MRKIFYESGFSAVELLITLFIGFLFVMMGYQLYTVSIQAGGEAREQSKASNLAYEELRKFQQRPGTNNLACPPGTNFYTNPVDNSKAELTLTITCPFTDATNILLVTVKVKYQTSQKEVSHALYVTQ